MEYILLGLILLLTGMIFYLYDNNKKLAARNRALQEIMEVKDITISNLQASRVAVKDVIENFSAHDEVMQLIDAGESRESISEKLGIPTSRIELFLSVKINAVLRRRTPFFSKLTLSSSMEVMSLALSTLEIASWDRSSLSRSPLANSAILTKFRRLVARFTSLLNPVLEKMLSTFASIKAYPFALSLRG